MASIGSIAVHPSAVAPAMAGLTNLDDADFLAYQTAFSSGIALHALVVVAERRMPDAADYSPARDLIHRLAVQGIQESYRWDESVED